MRYSSILLLAGALALPAVHADRAEAPASPSLGLAGLALGQQSTAVDWLVPAARQHTGCATEQHYFAGDLRRRFKLVGVDIAWPGIVYKFHRDRLYAVEAPLPERDAAFDELLVALTRRYGSPDAHESWHGAPPDSFVYRHRQRLAGWYDRQHGQSVWLTGNDSGGTLIITRGSHRASAQDPSGC
jgi:hypothetical protein